MDTAVTCSRIRCERGNDAFGFRYELDLSNDDGSLKPERKARHNPPPHIEGRSPALHKRERIVIQNQAIGGKWIGAVPRQSLKMSASNVLGRILFAKAFRDIHRFAVESEEQPILGFSQRDD
jgi:hypothetical protein